MLVERCAALVRRPGPPRTALGWVAAAALVVAACTGSADNGAAGGAAVPRTSSPPSPTPSAAASDEPNGPPGAPASPDADGRTGLPEAAGLGDALFPTLGNRGYDVGHYAIDLDVDPDGPALDAAVTIDAEATQRLDRFFLDFEGYELGGVTVDGAPARTRRTGEELDIAPSAPIPAGAAFTVVVEYAGVPPTALSEAGIGPVGWRTSGEGLLFVASEPDGAHAWFPSNDHPLDKATFAMSVTVPTPMVAAANGALLEQTDDGGTRTFMWEMDEPMAPYLATVVVGAIDIVPDARASRVSGVTIRHALPTGTDAAGPDGLDRVGDIIAFLAERFGPFPFDEYGVAPVDGVNFALETQTLTLLGQGPALRPFTERVIAHEIAHEWFGNSVSLERWQDLWVKEGAATYAEWLWSAERTGGRVAADAEARSAMRRVGTVRGSAGAPTATGLYTPNAYQGGALTYHALRAEVGDDVFFEVLRTFAETFAGDTADADDFVAVAERVSGRQLDAVFDAWLSEDDRPAAAPSIAGESPDVGAGPPTVRGSPTP